MKSSKKFYYSICMVFFFIVSFIFINLVEGNAEEKDKEKKKDFNPYVFKMVNEVKRTSVKNQARTGTCWDFATVSFLESELIRMGKGEYDLSEMFIVRNAYPLKAIQYIRMHGMANHSEGGQSHDVLDRIRENGIVPESVYNGMNINENKHNHGEMGAVLKGMLDGILKRSGRYVTPRWLEAYNAVLDVYMGKIPEKFEYNGKSYTPKTFRDELGINLDDYVEFTSYSIYPYYKQCRLDIPDNWSYNDKYYNVPMEDLEAIVDNAIKNGYSVAWDGDVSEKEFDGNEKGYAIIPEKAWDDKTKKEQDEDIKAPVKEKVITPEMREATFDNFSTTDDHLMHLVGIAKDQVGTKFYLIKNSWGTDRKYDGYLYMSESYFRLKTVCFMVHKDAVPAELRAKLKL